MNFLASRSGRKCLARAGAAVAIVATFIVAAGCGSGSHNHAVAPPGGSFTDSNLNGTYVFSFSGTDALNLTFFAVAGTFTANGSGTITGGTIDISDLAYGNLQNQSVTGGSYNITIDGRGSGKLNTNSPFGQIGIDFVMASSSRGLISRFDGAGTGSGTLDLAASGVTQGSLQGSYAFGMSGQDSVGNPLSTVGGFTLDANGNVTAGLQDFNDFGNSTNLTNLALTNSSVDIGSTPGKAQLQTNAAGFGAMQFDVWVVDATHLKFIETDATAALAGDAFVSNGNTAFPGGSLVFQASGLDTSGFPLATGGLLTSDGASQITGGLQDVNDAGSVAQAPSVTGFFSSSAGRSQLTLDGIFNGDAGPSNYTFAVYPYTGGAELLEIDNLGITGGVIYVQSANSIASSAGYAMNLSGANTVGEVDTIAEFTASGGTMSGLYDFNNLGLLGFNLGLGSNATYSVSSNGRGTGIFPNLQTNGNSVIGSLGFILYTIDNSTAVFLETDSNQLALGSLLAQNASGAIPGSSTHFNMIRAKAKAGAGAKWKGARH